MQLHNPGRSPLRLWATAGGNLLETRAANLPTVLVGPGLEPIRFKPGAGAGTLYLDIRAPLDDPNDVRQRGFSVELIGDRGVVIKTQRSWLTPVPSLFESVLLRSGAAAESRDFMTSEAWQGVVVVSEGTRYVQIGGDAPLLVRAFPSDPKRSTRRPADLAASRAWLYDDVEGSAQGAIEPENLSALKAAGRAPNVKVQARIVPVTTQTAAMDPTWKMLATVEAEANQA